MSKIALNSKAPGFELEDFNQKRVRLIDFMHNKHVVLVFNRGFL